MAAATCGEKSTRPVPVAVNIADDCEHARLLGHDSRQHGQIDADPTHQRRQKRVAASGRFGNTADAWRRPLCPTPQTADRPTQRCRRKGGVATAGKPGRPARFDQHGGLHHRRRSP